jgi:PIN domain nuclease of toxin-antitoxin system
MRILLDTHIALWAVTASRRLSRKGQQLTLGADEVHVSAATLWEISVKRALG